MKRYLLRVNLSDRSFVEGKADSLSILILDGEKVFIDDAKAMAGKTPREVDARLKDFHVAAIGPAGENLVRFACVINDAGKRQRAGVAGRGGLGAVMGSKNLKVIAVRGNLSPDNVAPTVNSWTSGQ